MKQIEQEPTQSTLQGDSDVTNGNSSDGSPTKLKQQRPVFKMTRSLIEKQQGSRSLLAGSMSSYSSNETRTSRFNDRPLVGSPMLAAMECLSSTCEEAEDWEEGEETVCVSRDDVDATTGTTTSTLTPSEASTLESSFASDSSKITSCDGMKRFAQKAKTHVVTAKELLDRKLKRFDSEFFKENPIHKIPRFVPGELSLGDQLGAGEFGTVHEIESLERQQPPLIVTNDFDAILEGGEHAEPDKKDSDRTTATHPEIANLTLPAATDLIVQKADLDSFLKRRVEAFEDQQKDRITPTVSQKKIQPTRLQKCDKENNDAENPFQNTRNNNNEHNGYTNQQLANNTQAGCGEDEDEDESYDFQSPLRRRPALKLKDRKGQMINRQNNNENFDGYAVKLVRDDIANERKKRVAAADMATEARILSALSHPNIISIRGIMGYIEKPGNYGIIMDKLRSTLQNQIRLWAKETKEDNVPRAAPDKHRLLEHVPEWMLIRQHERDKQKLFFRQTEFFIERMEAVVDVSEAMKYLHEKRIIFRDLKPENVGMTSENYVLFDFGLSRELKESDRVGSDPECDEYRATGLTGSRLFMAPEVALKKPYGFSADVFSFAIVFWEVVSLKEVFPNLTLNKHYKQVIVKGKRPPSLEDILPTELNDMMEASWDTDPRKRPTFESINEILTNELEKREGSTSKLFHGKNFFSSWADHSSRSDDPNTLSAEEFSKLDDYVYEGDAANTISRSGRHRGKKLAKQLHLDQLEHALEKVQETVSEKILKIPSSRSTSPTQQSDTQLAS